ncbi:RNA demethylase ALKBH5-like, partial [Trifolium medium]|nr:RNA demethylase ALKBH5-like [Trifolium medium]
ISITFRKMDERKLPYNFSPDPELVGIKPLIINSPRNKPERNSETQIEKDESFEFEYNPVWKNRKESFRVKEDYPPPINGSLRRMRGNEFGHRARY